MYKCRRFVNIFFIKVPPNVRPRYVRIQIVHINMFKLKQFILPKICGRSCPTLTTRIHGNLLFKCYSKNNSKLFMQSLPEGLQLADKENKPILLLMHRDWCQSCKKLLVVFRENSDVQAVMQANFVSVELTGQDEQLEEKYAPDGAYVPR